MYYSTHTINTSTMNNVCSDGNVVAVYFIAMCSSNNVMTMPDYNYVIGPVKINHVSTKNRCFFCL